MRSADGPTVLAAHLVGQGRTALYADDWRGARQPLLEAASHLYARALQLQGPQRALRAQQARRLMACALRLPAPPASGLLRLHDDESGDTPKVPAHPDGEAPRGPGLDAVCGHEGIKSQLMSKYVWPMRHPALARKFRQGGRGGVLLYGPPGTGKTLLVQALANE